MTNKELLERSAKVLEAASFGPLARVTAMEYSRIADRVQATRQAAGDAWKGIFSLGGAPATAASRRAAWSRRTHLEVASAIDDLRAKRVPVKEALDRLRSWLPEAEATPPCAVHPPGPTSNRTGKPLTRSKRHTLRELPIDWMDQVWAEAVDSRFRHLEELAVLITTGCRPAEACRAVDVFAGMDESLTITIAGAKVTEANGQPWRRLTIQVEGGPANYLRNAALRLPDGMVRLRPSCTPAALSMGVAAIGEALRLTHRISAYDVRHQRSADARHAFEGDVARLAAWMGHCATSTGRHYGRLPRSSGCRGASPLDAVGAREVRHRARSRAASVDVELRP